MHKHTSFYGFSSHTSYKERRLCWDDRPPETPLAIGEALLVREPMDKNIAMRGARALLRDPRIIGIDLTRPEHRVDLALFDSLVVSGLLGDRAFTEGGTVTLANLDVLDVLDIELTRIDLGTADAEAVEKHQREVGQRLIARLPLEQLNVLFPPTGSETKAVRDPVQVGAAFLRNRNHTALYLRDSTDVSPLARRAISTRDPQIQAILRLPYELFKHAQTELNRMLSTAGIPPPRDESADRIGSGLNRRDYLVLLAIMIREGGKGIRDALGDDGSPNVRVERIRKFIVDSHLALSRRLNNAYTVVAPGILAPTEVLDVTLGGVEKAYIAALRIGTRPTGPRTGPRPPTPDTIPSAATWPSNPGNALLFLQPLYDRGVLPHTPANDNFMNSLSFYVQYDRVVPDGMAAPSLTWTETQSRLQLIRDRLTGAADVVRGTGETLEESRKKLTVSETANKVLGGAIDMVKDWQNNPIPALVIGVGAFFLIRGTWRFLRQERSPMGKLMMAAGFGALALGFYQERNGRHAFWTGGLRNLRETMTGETPERERSISYWTEQIAGSEMERTCINMLHFAEAHEVHTWYLQMQEYNRNRSGTRLPEFPRSFDMARNRRMFTGLNSAAISGVLFGTMKKFFENRGRRLEDEGISYPGRRGNREALGLEYFRSRYVSRRTLAHVLEMEYTVGTETFTLDFVREGWDSPETEALHKRILDLPDGARTWGYIEYLHTLWVRESETTDETPRDTPMWQVFLSEGEVGILGSPTRRDNPIAAAIGWTRRRVDDADFMLGRPFERRDDEIARKTTLLTPGSYEEDLLDSYTGGGRFVIEGGRRADVDLGATLAIAQTEWREFLDRVPLTLAARNAVQNHVNEYVYAHPGASVADLLNEFEQWKYQITIAASSSADSVLLSEDIVRRMRDRADGVWGFDWMRTLIPDWAADRGFPTIESLDDVLSLFDSTVTRDGGVPAFQVWRRIFPAWSASGFGEMAEQIRGFRAELRLLRMTPFVFGPSDTGVTAANIDALEQYEAQMFARRLLEAMITTHDGTPRGTPTPPGRDRSVTGVEQANLIEYFGTVHRRLVPARLLQQQELIAKRAAEVRNAFGSTPDTQLDVVFLSNGRVAISRRNPTLADRFRLLGGVFMPYTAMTVADYEAAVKASPPLFHWHEMTVSDFLTLDVHTVVLQRWKEAAVTEKLANVRTGYPAFEARLDPAAPRTDVLFRFAPAPAAERRLHILEWLSIGNVDMSTRWEAWVKRGANPADVF